MEFLDKLLQPQVIGPLIGLFAVVGGLAVAGLKLYFNHQERIEKIRNGIDPDFE
ncbi:MAG: hypothetical protein GY808_13290 [Gammaproteobacteria bacterium]|nr:hypothetical protein [Gammaproteobacteria bacterium]